ncbi:hypothetical protein EXIGLDRAFT_719991 [Exidia glandulosa HHB12029]|uniref:Uncharacterized protein n=1 Tax=Exidia glandulosa HHB12029 TaxID=1314781 RepID=A0A165NLS1_EXIGL|nr:hypothetical protein EXIGLDRAFT_719991 [Exidia glandulosa HHB12029]
MPPDTDAARWKRILREQADAAELELRVAALERARAEAVLVLEQARSAVDDFDGELHGMRQRQQQAADHVAQMRMNYRRELLRRMPAELLSYIFEEVTALPADFRETTKAVDCYNEALTMAPFCLAAVCSKWRNVALQQSTLWTYISAPSDMEDDETGKQHHNRVKLLLARSHSSALDVLISWAGVDDWVGCVAEVWILQAVAVHAGRWRTFELWLPDNSTDGYELQILRMPLPRVERLCIVVDIARPVHRDADDGYLPFAPTLRELTIWGPNVISMPARVSFPALTSLRLWHHPQFDLVWRLLSTVAPTLESLLLSFDSDEKGPDIPKSVIALPNLRSASLLISSRTIWRRMHRLHVPNLRHLTMETQDAIADVVQPFLDMVADTVVSLTLSGDVSLSELVLFKTLLNVESLQFDVFGYECDEQYEVFSDFFAAEAVWVQQKVWPKLSSVILSTNGSVLDEEYERLMPFVRWRTVDVDRWEGDDTAPRRLETLALNGQNAPLWVISQAQVLISSRYELATGQ